MDYSCNGAVFLFQCAESVSAFCELDSAPFGLELARECGIDDFLYVEILRSGEMVGVGGIKKGNHGFIHSIS